MAARATTSNGHRRPERMWLGGAVGLNIGAGLVAGIWMATFVAGVNGHHPQRVPLIVAVTIEPHAVVTTSGPGVLLVPAVSCGIGVAVAARPVRRRRPAER